MAVMSATLRLALEDLESLWSCFLVRQKHLGAASVVKSSVYELFAENNRLRAEIDSQEDNRLKVEELAEELARTSEALGEARRELALQHQTHVEVLANQLRETEKLKGCIREGETGVDKLTRDRDFLERRLATARVHVHNLSAELARKPVDEACPF